MGPATLPRETSLVRYLETTRECERAEGLFRVAELSLGPTVKPSLKPKRRPSKT